MVKPTAGLSNMKRWDIVNVPLSHDTEGDMVHSVI